MGIFRAVLYIFLICLPAFTFAYTAEEGKVTATIGPFFYKTNFNDSISGARSPYKEAFGLIALGDVNDKGSLEIGMFYMNKLFFRESADKFIAEQTQALHITMGYRYWLSHYVSTSLSFYSAYSMGIPEIVHNDFSVADTPDTSARDATEYGFDFSTQAELWSRGKYAVMLDARYSWNVTPKPTEHADHYGVMIGLRYLIQEKSAPKKDSEDAL